jgi:acyl-CoA dehydrogenase
MLLLARTDPEAPKHLGIRFFLLDLSGLGVTIQHLVDMADRHHFNQVLSDNVGVSKENMVREENLG